MNTEIPNDDYWDYTIASYYLEATFYLYVWFSQLGVYA